MKFGSLSKPSICVQERPSRPVGLWDFSPTEVDGTLKASKHCGVSRGVGYATLDKVFDAFSFLFLVVVVVVVVVVVAASKRVQAQKLTATEVCICVEISIFGL